MNGEIKTISHINKIISNLEDTKIISTDDISDGQHTFGELYDHRAILFSLICHYNKDKSWKSKLHDDGTMFDDYFIVGIETPKGQATYHYKINPYWEIFNVKELDNAPKYDGHTPADALKRIQSLITK